VPLQVKKSTLWYTNPRASGGGCSRTRGQLRFGRVWKEPHHEHPSIEQSNSHEVRPYAAFKHLIVQVRLSGILLVGHYIQIYYPENILGSVSPYMINTAREDPPSLVDQRRHTFPQSDHCHDDASPSHRTARRSRAHPTPNIGKRPVVLVHPPLKIRGIVIGNSECRRDPSRCLHKRQMIVC